jgi:hypothetical protein
MFMACLPPIVRAPIYRGAMPACRQDVHACLMAAPTPGQVVRV